MTECLTHRHKTQASAPTAVKPTSYNKKDNSIKYNVQVLLHFLKKHIDRNVYKNILVCFCYMLMERQERKCMKIYPTFKKCLCYFELKRLLLFISFLLYTIFICTTIPHKLSRQRRNLYNVFLAS